MILSTDKEVLMVDRAIANCKGVTLKPQFILVPRKCDLLQSSRIVKS